MRAAVLPAFAATPEIRDVPDPSGEGSIVEVVAAGLNPVDLRMASGTFYAPVPDPPYTPGLEGVARDGDGRLAYFERAIPPHGALAQRALVPTGGLWPLPDGLEPGLALACGVAGTAAWLALDLRADLQEGESVLVLGATGVSGLVGVQVARRLGAAHVVAAGRDASRLAHATRVGAASAVRLGGEDDAAALRDAAPGGGFDVVLDLLWGEPLAAALGACAFGARVVHVGQSAGAVSPLGALDVRGKGLVILGHSNFHVAPQARHDAFDALAHLAAAGELDVPVERVALEALPAAWERQAGSPGAKLVVVPS